MTGSLPQSHTAFKSFGKNSTTLLNEALPAHQSQHVLALGEAHEMVKHYKMLKNEWGKLSDPAGHNVGTFALERNPYTSVFFWALKDGKLPVKPGNEQQYVERMMQYMTAPALRPNAVEATRLGIEVMKQGGTVLMFDARKTWSGLLTEHGKSMQAVYNRYFLSDTYLDSIRNDPKTAIFDKKLDEDLRTGMLKTTASHENRPYQKRGEKAADAKQSVYALVAYAEIMELLARHPEYAARLDAIEKPGLKARFSKLPEDAQSAAIVYAHADPAKNVLAVSGGAHLIGLRSTPQKFQGTFAEHLVLKGMKVTPIIVRLQEVMSMSIADYAPGGENYPELKNECAAKTPIRMWVIDQDIVMDISNKAALQNLVKRETAVEGKVKALAQKMLNAGTVMTCDQPELPTLRDCAVQESQGRGSCPPRGGKR